MDYLNANICNVKNFIETKLKKRLLTKAVLESVDCKLIADGMGQLSRIYRVNLIWSCNDETVLPNSVVLKLPRLKDFSDVVKLFQNNKNKRIDQTIEFIKASHNVECDIYDIFESLKNPPLPLMRCYYAEKSNGENSGILIFEDMSLNGISEDFSTILNLDEIFNLISLLVDLHVWSLTTSVDWKSKCPALLNRLKDTTDKYALMGGLQNFVNDYPEEFGFMDVERICHYMHIDNLTKRKEHLMNTTPKVLVHGDFKANNIFFKKRSDGTASSRIAAIIDWQTAEVGSMIDDICSLLVISTSSTIRREHEKNIIQYYLNCLTAKLPKTLHQIIPDYETLWHAYKQIFLFRVVLLLNLSAIIVKHKNDNLDQFNEIMDRITSAYYDAMEFLDEDAEH
ncbi:calcium/calmodulin-dependent protein kinase type 1 [Trichinella spiralis]|nr:calcium/calmodulin-dependent protein kinase type 1 [Trichinella spiralis]KRY27973.1 putative oxidoreductase -like protein dhs-27 [Trichinella spiralis]KRY27976.1 putative oxidoreductase -like protein dhs-27 [Trichinella spiralis]